jgi:hypothetical protein
MKKAMKTLCICLLSGWMTFNAKLLDTRELTKVQGMLAQYGHVTKLTEGSLITDGTNLILLIVKTHHGSTIEIKGDKQEIREIKESY